MGVPATSSERGYGPSAAQIEIPPEPLNRRRWQRRERRRREKLAGADYGSRTAGGRPSYGRLKTCPCPDARNADRGSARPGQFREARTPTRRARAVLPAQTKLLEATVRTVDRDAAEVCKRWAKRREWPHRGRARRRGKRWV